MTTTQSLPLARYLGLTDARHHFALLSDWTTPHRLVAGSVCTDKVIRELGGNLPDSLDNLAKDALIYPATQP